MTNEAKLTREQLEQEIIDRLPTIRPLDLPIVKESLSYRTREWLEDILKRMKESGR
jgi:pyruvate/2-oxoglutarate/acetoin dehydrogenase E1 component